jgi:hypothetical protein
LSSLQRPSRLPSSLPSSSFFAFSCPEGTSSLFNFYILHRERARLLLRHSNTRW